MSIEVLLFLICLYALGLIGYKRAKAPIVHSRPAAMPLPPLPNAVTPSPAESQPRKKTVFPLSEQPPDLNRLASMAKVEVRYSRSKNEPNVVFQTVYSEWVAIVYEWEFLPGEAEEQVIERAEQWFIKTLKAQPPVARQA